MHSQVAVIATIPWDAYLIQQRIWSYPAQVILGPTLFGIPAEEIFFFVIQTYNTTLLYLLLGKPVLHAAYLAPETVKRDGNGKSHRKGSVGRMSIIVGHVVLVLLVAAGIRMVQEWKQATYLGLILVWAGPFALMLWYEESVVLLPDCCDGVSGRMLEVNE